MIFRVSKLKPELLLKWTLHNLFATCVATAEFGGGGGNPFLVQAMTEPKQNEFSNDLAHSAPHTVAQDQGWFCRSPSHSFIFQ